MERSLGVVVVAVVLGTGAIAQNLRYRTSPHLPGASAVAAPGGPAPVFELVEAADAAGLRHRHGKLDVHPSLSNVAPFIAALAGAGVSVADVDGDGAPDVLLLSAKRGTRDSLFLNDRHGGFTDITERAGLADANRDAGSLRAIFADFDNDGRKDLFLTTGWCPKLYRNMGKTFTDATKGSGLDHCGLAVAANVVDYDGDGFLDLVVADYWPNVDLYDPKTTRFMPNNWVAADNGGPITVYHNEHGRGFKAVPGSLGIRSRGWTQAVGVYDLKGRGKPDLYFGTDFGLDQVYYHGGSGYDDGSDALGETFSKHGMNAEIADVDNDGTPLIYITHIYEPGRIVDQNMLRKFSGGKFETVSRLRGVNQCGWSWGAKFLDLDNDGFQDLVVSNGMMSQNPAKDHWYNMQLISMSNGDVMVDSRRWRPIGDGSLAAYEQKCLFHNTGGGFEDLTARTPLAEDRTDGRALAAIDVLGDGSLSFIEAVVGGAPRFYRNTQKNAHAWIGFSLEGTRSNRDAFGAKVTVRLADGRTLTRQLQPANGFEAQSDARLHFGLGEGAAVSEVEVRWPSGTVQTVDARQTGRYHRLVEPK